MRGITTSLFGRRYGLNQVNRPFYNYSNRYVIPAGITLYTNTAASTAVSNATAETLFDTYATIPANALDAGDLIRIRYQGIATSTNSTDTLTIRLRLGGVSGTVLAAHTATDVANNDVFQGEYELIIRTIGASGTVVGCGTFKAAPAAEGTITVKDDILASTALDTTADIVIGATAQWSVASASNSCRLDFVRVIIA